MCKQLHSTFGTTPPQCKNSPCFTFLFFPDVNSNTAAKTINSAIISISIPAAADTAISNSCAELSALIEAMLVAGGCTAELLTVDWITDVIIVLPEAVLVPLIEATFVAGGCDICAASVVAVKVIVVVISKGPTDNNYIIIQPMSMLDAFRCGLYNGQNIIMDNAIQLTLCAGSTRDGCL